MTDGTFRTWEQVTLGFGGAMMLIGLFVEDLGRTELNYKWFMLSFALATLSLFAKPVWLFGNWKEIRTWERVTAVVRQIWSTGRGRRTKYHIYIEFFSKDGKMYHKTLEGRYAANFKVGGQNSIMFAREYMDALIFVPQAFRQAVISAVIGAVLETGFVLCLILL